MKQLTTSLLAAFCLLSTSILAQHIDIDKKALSFLASEETLNIQIDFNGVVIDNNVSESDFLVKMHKKIVNHRDQAEADQWAKDYVEFKNEIWPATFIEVLNNKLKDYKNAPQFIENNTDANYLLKVKIPWMYYGYDAGIVNEPAKVTMLLEFSKSDAPNEPLFTTEISRAMGKYNKTDGDGEGVGPSLNRMRKAITTAAYKLAKALKRVVD
ncbi:hypothetical protein [Ulvibacter antarcticus]|uniref:GLPGLI family protein n=1 Tax=Ulvibacter antarcticus TaxID=442714 RepID=A0A3L9YAY8_9FLAO|nr:hypothetical protein [Ulvibacter antarcticus]RMA57893.1 hypothetical protein BXY75_2700 [Ulvibacter antarcticus]